MPSIQDQGLVEAHFGYWPTFRDARVIALKWTPASIRFTVSFADPQTDRGARIEFECIDPQETVLDALRERNVLDALTFTGEGPMTVVLQAAIGLTGTIRCTSVRVRSLIPEARVPASAGSTLTWEREGWRPRWDKVEGSDPAGR